jgi:hypothetical protein
LENRSIKSRDEARMEKTNIGGMILLSEILGWIPVLQGNDGQQLYDFHPTFLFFVFSVSSVSLW